MARRYITHGTCVKLIDLDTKDGIIVSCDMHGGCPGQGRFLKRLVTGKRIDDVRPCLSGIVCRNGTSCADQLSKALDEERRRGEDGV